MFSLFTVPKPFIGHARIIQTNAIRSWRMLGASCEIILFGDEPGIGEMASEVGASHVSEVSRNEYGTPVISHIFRQAQARARHDIVCYANADIIFFGDFARSIRRMSEWKRDFLLAGRRRNTRVDDFAEFDASWESRLRDRAFRKGKMDVPNAIDYFVFRRGQFAEMPPFLIGRPFWDMWLLSAALSMKIPLVDATKAVTAVHQTHDYAHVPSGSGRLWEGPEADYNERLAGGKLATLDHATWFLTPRGIRPTWATPEYALRAFYYSHIFKRKQRFWSPDSWFYRSLRALWRSLRTTATRLSKRGNKNRAP